MSEIISQRKAKRWLMKDAGYSEVKALRIIEKLTKIPDGLRFKVRSVDVAKAIQKAGDIPLPDTEKFSDKWYERMAQTV